MGSLNRISRVEEVDKLDIHLCKFEASRAGFAQMGAYSFYTDRVLCVPNYQWNMLLMCSG